jgi:hypothetical protein
MPTDYRGNMPATNVLQNIDKTFEGIKKKFNVAEISQQRKITRISDFFFLNCISAD